MFECPYCGEKTISIKDKHLIGYWMSRNCSSCGTRVGGRPIPLALIYFVYSWNALWWISMYVYSSMTGSPDISYFLYMVICWIVLDVININVIPLGAMKKKPE